MGNSGSSITNTSDTTLDGVTSSTAAESVTGVTGGSIVGVGASLGYIAIDPHAPSNRKYWEYPDDDEEDGWSNSNYNSSSFTEGTPVYSAETMSGDINDPEEDG